MRVGLRLGTVDGDSRVGCHWSCAEGGWQGGGQRTLNPAGTLCLSFDPRIAYAPSATCLFSFFTYSARIFMSYNLGRNATVYFGGLT